MEFLLTAAELVINLDQHLTDIIQSYREGSPAHLPNGLLRNRVGSNPFYRAILLFVIGALGAVVISTCCCSQLS